MGDCGVIAVETCTGALRQLVQKGVPHRMSGSQSQLEGADATRETITIERTSEKLPLQ